MKKKELINNFESMKIKDNAFSNKEKKIRLGDVVSIQYLTTDNEKEKIHSYEGLIISIKNEGFCKNFNLYRQAVHNINVEQIFLANSPKILSIIKKQTIKVRRSKLYFLRALKNKSLINLHN